MKLSEPVVVARRINPRSAGPLASGLPRTSAGCKEAAARGPVRRSQKPAAKSRALMAIELVLDASVSLAWFLKETPERAAYAAAVNAAAAEGAILHVPVQWGIEISRAVSAEEFVTLLETKKELTPQLQAI